MIRSEKAASHTLPFDIRRMVHWCPHDRMDTDTYVAEEEGRFRFTVACLLAYPDPDPDAKVVSLN